MGKSTISMVISAQRSQLQPAFLGARCRRPAEIHLAPARVAIILASAGRVCFGDCDMESDGEIHGNPVKNGGSWENDIELNGGFFLNMAQFFGDSHIEIGEF